MNNAFLDLCYRILTQYTQYSDVQSTLKDINDGVCYAQLYSQTPIEFIKKHNEIVEYISKVRKDNILDSFIDDKNYLLLVPVQNGKPLSQSTPEELFTNLANEINRLRFKGIYQVIKHIQPYLSDYDLLNNLFTKEAAALQEYGLISE